MSTITPVPTPRLQLPSPALAEFCQRWKIAKLELFGSALGISFRPDSDVDFLVTFSPDARWSLLDLARAAEELGHLIGHPVDLVERPGVEQSDNWIRRREILSTARPLYVA
ncbi:MAG: nucleotidyltransferase family protein [Bacillota bacterium]